MNLEQKHKQQCLSHNCPHVQRCTTFFGVDCREQGGSRIPRHRYINYSMQRPSPMKAHFDTSMWNADDVLMREG